jgi:hypothetical protein
MAPFRSPSVDSLVIAAHRSACASIARGFLVAALLSFGALLTPALHAAEFIPNPNFVPKPDTYICPNSAGSAVECYLEAVAHLYTMCRNVKSIEIIEWGYEKSTEGTNGAKSEYCIDKHRLSMTRPYQAALKEATPNAAAVDGLRALQELWLKSLSELKWNPGETDEQYKARVTKPYEVFTERATAVRAVMVASKDKAPPTADKGKKGKPATPPPKTKSAT